MRDYGQPLTKILARAEETRQVGSKRLRGGGAGNPGAKPLPRLQQQPILHPALGVRQGTCLLHPFRARRQLIEDSQISFMTAPVLLETFVEVPRFQCSIYRAAGWTRVGTTQGRVRYDIRKKFAEPANDIWICPLRKDWKRVRDR